MKILFGKYKNCYKANLHCHSTYSDGTKTPEELKEAYKSRGYSVIAYTDHEHIIAHPELCDSGFVAISACELAIKEFPEESTLVNKTMKVTHINLYAKEIDNTVTPCYSTVQDHFKREMLQHLIRKDGEYSRKYSPECINEMIKRGVENGFFVTYNHPTWSLERYPEYMSYHGMHAMEITNYGCIVEGFDDYNPREFDDMLLGGKRVFCSATDDNHNGRDDSFGGFNMIKAESLTYENIANALLRGDFYASQGPLIHDLYMEDGQIHITTSPAASISLITDRRRAGCVHAKEGEPLCHASFPFSDIDLYFRLTVTDAEGKHANTQAYYPKEILQRLQA